MSRLWVDANIILRFITKEPEEMAERAARLMAQAEAGEVSLYISPLIIAEMVWVLRSFYQYTMAEIAVVLIPLVTATGIEVEDRELTIRALESSRDQNVDYIDAYLAHQAAASGERVCTFDTADFRKLPVEWMTPDS
ncbi:MAG: PIN domain-containing protein [Candidatus Tectomicrobia bacterium]|nr:PIN domain-containing protein [Candidatus Tectomicrobia bacterium]